MGGGEGGRPAGRGSVLPAQALERPCLQDIWAAVRQPRGACTVPIRGARVHHLANTGGASGGEGLWRRLRGAQGSAQELPHWAGQ